jgi:hypothetical protein
MWMHKAASNDREFGFALAARPRLQLDERARLFSPVEFFSEQDRNRLAYGARYVPTDGLGPVRGDPLVLAAR